MPGITLRRVGVALVAAALGVAGTWDRAAHAAEVKERVAVEAALQEIAGLVDAGNFAAALDAARRAAVLAPAEGEVLDTLAHLLALAGDLPAAIAAQRQAAAHAGDQAESINAYLKELEARAGAK